MFDEPSASTSTFSASMVASMPSGIVAYCLTSLRSVAEPSVSIVG